MHRQKQHTSGRFSGQEKNGFLTRGKGTALRWCNVQTAAGAAFGSRAEHKGSQLYRTEARHTESQEGLRGTHLVHKLESASIERSQLCRPPCDAVPCGEESEQLSFLSILRSMKSRVLPLP